MCLEKGRPFIAVSWNEGSARKRTAIDAGSGEALVVGREPDIAVGLQEDRLVCIEPRLAVVGCRGQIESNVLAGTDDVETVPVLRPIERIDQLQMPGCGGRDLGLGDACEQQQCRAGIERSSDALRAGDESAFFSHRDNVQCISVDAKEANALVA